ncbi:MAG: AAA family ATPase [Candidatus Methanoperedens sp.]|nr:AAA family ATPase [Candidatus Methanoperedens sp.]
MVNASLKKVFIKNFKSLHDCEIDIGKLNVVVGANASGKSNLVEAFRLLKKIYVDKDPFPFLEWWGYDNVVWQRKEELPIIIGLLFDIEGYDVYFETNFTGTGGKFQILRELLDIKGYLKFEKKGEWTAVKHDMKFIDAVIEKPQKYNVISEGKLIISKHKDNLTKEVKIPWGDLPNLLGLIQGFGYNNKYNNIKEKNVAKISYEKIDDWEIFAPVVVAHRYKEKEYYGNIYAVSSKRILLTLEKLSVLYPLNIRLMKNPQPLRREETIKEDGTNIASVYHTIYLKEGKIPEEIYNPLTMVFPKIDVRPHLTDDSRIMIKFKEDGFELLPPNTSDGFYKILTVLVAIYLKPPLLIIDEIENSLHPETLELILDTIKASDVQAIITTHSPVVVDMTEPDDMILVEKERGESRFKRIKDPDKIRTFLKEKGIKFSTGWLYGEISHIE